MIKRKSLLLLAGMMIPTVGLADQVIEGNLGIEKAFCVGFDCVNGGSLPPGELRLKENNTRIRLHNTEVAKQRGAETLLGESWNIEANASANGGQSYFDFQVKSVSPDNTLSDGTAPAFNCEAGAVTKHPAGSLPIVGTVPFGGQIMKPHPIGESCEVNDKFQFVCFHECVPDETLRHTAARVMTLGTKNGVHAFADSVSLGYQRDFSVSPAQGTVALGQPELKRQLKYLADALNPADLVNLRSLKFSRVEGMLAQLTLLNGELDNLEKRIDQYQDSITNTVNLSQDGSTTTVALNRRNILVIDTPQSPEPYGPKQIHIAFYPAGGEPLDGLTVKDSEGNSYSLNGWWQQLSLALKPNQVSVLLLAEPGKSVNVQWWYGW